MYVFDEAIIMDIDPLKWDSTGYTRHVASCNADFFRIRDFGTIYLYTTDSDYKENHPYDLYLSKTAPLRDANDEEDEYFGYLTMADYKRFETIDVLEDMANPGSFVKENSVQEAVLKTFNASKELAGKEPLPFVGNFRLMGQVYNDDGYQKLKTSVELYFRYIYVR
ncbi:hypothetical protein [Butyrivibrio sp. VCD2006]|uniref:hypothetical protein n=1 Tax=Butyrivibrio sp. VCD2006 TaxID=1280664 RepID=UPI0004152B09|nr:hypothetical protein [Butyrivibrio sp. VCD2006]